MKCSFDICRIKVGIVQQACPCSYCKMSYCSYHRLPESHDCPNLKEGLKHERKPKVKPKFVDYSRGGGIGA